MGGEWVKREFVPAEDTDVVVYLWLKSYARSAYGQARGADRVHTQTELAYWSQQEPVVKALLRSVDVEVIADPERPRASSAGPAVIWAFAATSGDVVHYVSVKRKLAREVGAELVQDLLGSRLERACGYTHELVEMRNGACGVRIPREWYSDSTWLARALLGPVRQAA